MRDDDSGDIELADRSIHRLDVYSAVVIWDGQSRSIHVNAVETDPLVGMKLLEGYRLTIDVTPGGGMEIVPMSPPPPPPTP